MRMTSNFSTCTSLTQLWSKRRLRCSIAHICCGAMYSQEPHVRLSPRPIFDKVLMLLRMPNSDTRAQHIHIYIVGTLPISRGCSTLLAMVDCFTRFPVILPIQIMNNISNNNVEPSGSLNIVTSMQHSIFFYFLSRTGVPATIMTDRRTHFESIMLNADHSSVQWDNWTVRHLTVLNCGPQATDMVERLHNTLKSSLMAQPDPYNWARYLPLVVLSFHTMIKKDLDCSPAELTFRTTLRLMADFFCSICHSAPRSNEAFASQL